MRRSSLSCALICAGLLAVSSGLRSADAADMPPWPQSQPAGVVQEFVSGWYLRGDVGYRTDVKIGDFTSTFPLSNENIDEVATIGAGGGYKAGWFRADVTFDYAGRAQFKGDGFVPGTYNSKIESLTSLGNVYIDLGTWSGLTPYVGVGAGAISYRVYDYNSPDGIVDKHSHTDFAWAYMAGVAWCFAPRWLIDFSYRRLNMGEVKFNTSLVNDLTLKDLTANEFRIGLRYNFD